MISGFMVTNKPSDLFDGDRVVFTVRSEDNYNGKGKFWKVEEVHHED